MTLKPSPTTAYESSLAGLTDRLTRRQPLSSDERTVIHDLLRPHEYDALTLAFNTPSAYNVAGVALTTRHDKHINDATLYDHTVNAVLHTTSYPGLNDYLATEPLDDHTTSPSITALRRGHHQGRHVIRPSPDTTILTYTTSTTDETLRTVNTWHD